MLGIIKISQRVIDDGKIIEQGSHKELLAKEFSLYKKLWTLQAGGFLKDTKDEEEQKTDEETVADDDEEEGEDENW